MKKITSILILFVLVCLGGCKIRKGLNIDEGELRGLAKPLVDRINPQGIIYNNIGFSLTVFGDFSMNDEYVLYLNKTKLGISSPNYWRYRISWEIPDSFLKNIVNSAGSGDTQVEVRVSSIVDYDISEYFVKYRDYVSDVKILQIKTNRTDFSAPARLFTEWDQSFAPVLRIDNKDYIYLAWRELMGENWQAMFCFSQDGGLTWSQVLNISRSAKSIGIMDMDVDEQGHFYMVWVEGDIGSHHVFFSRSLDFGATWYNPRQISKEPGYTMIPRIEVDMQGKIYLFWSYFLPDGSYDKQKVILTMSTDQGDNWDEVLFKESVDSVGHPAVKSGKDGTVYFICGGYDGIECFHSIDAGISWQVNGTGIEGNSWKSMNTSLVIDENNTLFLVWNTEDYLGHNPNSWIHFANGTDGGADWNNFQQIDSVCNTSGGSAGIVVNAGHINMVLESPPSLFLLQSVDEGKTWTFPEFIPGTEEPAAPTMVMDKTGNIYLVYVGDYNFSQNIGGLKLITWQSNN